MANVFQITISAVDRATAVAQKVNTSIAKITRPIADVRSSVAAFSKETGLDQIGRRIEKVGGIATETARRVGSIAPPLAAIAGLGTVAGIVEMAHGWGKAATEISNTAYVIGMSTEQLQKYRGAARLAGLGDADMTNGLKAVGSAFEDASAGRDTFLAGVLKQKDIGIHRLKDGSIDVVRAMRDISNAASKYGNAQAREKFLSLFGMGNLTPLLGKGTAALDARVAQYDKLNATMSPAQIAQGERYNEAMVALDATFDKLTNSVGASLAPALTRVADALIPIANEYGPKIAHWIDSIDWNKTAKSIADVTGSLGGLTAIAAGLAAVTFAGPISGIARLSALLLPLVPALAPLAALAAGGAYAIGKIKDSTEGGHFVGRNAAAPIANPLSASDSNGLLWDRFKSGAASFFSTGQGHFVPRFSTRAGNASTAASKALFAQLEQQYRLPAGLLDSVWATESGRGANMRSPKGALGHFQFMPDTARQYGVADPMDLQQSARGAARMYADLLKANGGDVSRAVAAYNWGQGNLNRKGVANAPAETRDYVAKVLGGMGASAFAPAAPAATPPAVATGQSVQAVANAQQPSAKDARALRPTDSPEPVQAPLFAATPAAAAPDAGVEGQMGTVHVQIDMQNAPRGSKASVRTSGNVTASARIGHSALMEAAV
ncbi:transglycosylase SLT domain-containing protein [Paraburkholderia sp. BR14263]|uniref:transglycosylase SLT domain-containing protein n=1 Tax=unclassified Paraburkholderia TaxID=2615204 RepID=UPI0034CDE32D